jgi:hypothetical protein
VNGTIILTSELDFEEQAMYMLTVFAVVGTDTSLVFLHLLAN